MRTILGIRDLCGRIISKPLKMALFFKKLLRKCKPANLGLDKD